MGSKGTGATAQFHSATTSATSVITFGVVQLKFLASSQNTARTAILVQAEADPGRRNPAARPTLQGLLHNLDRLRTIWGGSNVKELGTIGKRDYANLPTREIHWTVH